MPEERYDTIVVGAGLSGLAAGIRIAQAGYRVCVLERHYLWGGLNSFYKRGGRLFDTGLHALTNYAPKGARGVPLARFLKQLRLRHDDLRLLPQSVSRIACGGARLAFSNDVALLEAEVAAAFPTERDRFAALVRELRELPLGAVEDPERSARAELSARLRDPLLVDALLLPACYYGSAREDDVDWDQFVILFHSLFLEGFSMPAGGVRPFLKLLVDRLGEAGGTLRLKSGVERVLVEGGAAAGVALEDGTLLRADHVISSAGWVETLRLAGLADDTAERAVGRLSFVETIACLDRRPDAISPALDACVAFYSTAERLAYRRPDELVDQRSGVVSMPTNYVGTDPSDEGRFRVTVLANHARWTALEDDAYAAAKRAVSDEALRVAGEVCGGDVRPHETFRDVFTPRTITKWTGKLGGAVYGSPRKHRDGRTPLPGLSVCGTDQGMLGVVGAALSGIAVANRNVLAPRAARAGAPLGADA